MSTVELLVVLYFLLVAVALLALYLVERRWRKGVRDGGPDRAQARAARSGLSPRNTRGRSQAQAKAALTPSLLS
jgi:hypothetical protein